MTDRPYTPPPYPYRQPGEESLDLYPGLVVCDGRVTGSITAGRTRLPLWAIPVHFDGDDYLTGDEGVDAGDVAAFVHHLLQARGEFGRLLLVLAEVERAETARRGPWWYVAARRRRVRRQLLRCLNSLGPD